jgi:preprotein translocase subunit SecF
VSNELSSLEQEVEQTREHLADTIDQLLHRAHPKTIVSREVTTIKAHFVDERTGEPRTDNILKAVGGVLGVIALFVVIRRVAS